MEEHDWGRDGVRYVCFLILCHCVYVEVCRF